jgi:hypothetical protein
MKTQTSATSRRARLIAVVDRWLQEEETMAKLTYGERKKLKTSTFAIPSERKYPIPDKSHARNALARVSQFGSPAEKAKVRAAVHRKFPSIGQKSGVPLKNLA